MTLLHIYTPSSSTRRLPHALPTPNLAQDVPGRPLEPNGSLRGSSRC
jgi:hypothetical protein